MKKNAFVLYGELQKKYGGAIRLASSPPHQPNHRDGGASELALWIHTSPSFGGREEWQKVRRPPGNTIAGLCQKRKCSGKCRTAHSSMEENIWKLLEENELYLEVFIHTAQIPDEPFQEDETPQRSRLLRQTPRRYRENTSPELLMKFNQFFAKWKGRFVLVCKQCYSLKPKVIKEMEISDGKDPKVYCRWCLGKKYILLHEVKFEGKVSRGKNIIFHEYNTVRQIPRSSVMINCKNPENCSKGDNCEKAHSNIELEFWNLDRFDILFNIIRYCNREANSGRDTLNGMFYCECCCLSFLQPQDYHKYMKRPHEHFDEICRSTTCWRYDPLPRQVSDQPFQLCQYRTKGYCSRSCQKAHSEKEREEWNKRKRIATARSRFSLQSDATWFDLKELPKDLQEESRLEVILENPRRQINIADGSVKWSLEIICTDKKFILHKLGFCQNSGFELRKDDEKTYKSMIHLYDDDKLRHKFKVLFINPKDRYGTISQDLICEFTGSKHYTVQFQVDIAGDNMEIPEISPHHYDNDWVQQRTIIRYHNPGTLTNSYEDKVKELIQEYQWRSPVNDIDMSNLSPHNYAEKMHDLLYAEEESRRAILSRLNIKSEIQYGEDILPNGNMVATFFIPISVSTDEASLFERDCKMILMGADEDKYAYECKIIMYGVEGKMDSQDQGCLDMTKVTINVPAACCNSLKLKPKSSSVQNIQFQLNRALFGLRHYAVDNIGDKIALLCPSEDKLAFPPILPRTKMSEKLDSVQDIVRQYVVCAKNVQDTAKIFPPMVVAGPFGTGKTHTIKQILYELLQDSDTPLILVCTHTNSAADLYLEDPRLAAFGHEKILRVVYHGRKPSTIPARVQKFCLFDKSGRLRYPTLREIMPRQLIVTTFATAMCIFLESGFTSGLFKYIFLDESSQAMEADVMMPLLLANIHETRIIIAGDHRQTTAKMYSDEKGEVKTLLERLYEIPEKDNVITIRLRNNYRCVKGILELISKLFYKKNALHNASRAECVTGLNAVYFIHIQGECFKTLYGDYANPSEAYQILHKVKMLVNKPQMLNQSDIVILSPFRSQIEWIRRLLRKHELGSVSVVSVDQIQGQEFKVVILTTVLRRRNCLETPGKSFGFLTDFRLLNVALSRAKSLVVVVGDAVTLCSIGNCKKQWKLFIQHCKERNCILPKGVDIDSLKGQISLAQKDLRPSAAAFSPGTKFTPAAVTPQETDEQNSEKVRADSTTTPSDIEDTSSYEDDDDTDSWCSEASLDDIILNDMVNDKPIALSKVTIEVGEDHREFLQYDFEDEDDEEEDPNETPERPSRQKQPRTAIYPKFTIEQLEQMLKRDTAKYKRCKINIKNWYSAEAVPLSDEADQNLPEDLTVSNETEKSSSDNDGDSPDEVAYEISLGSEPVEAVPITRISNIIYIETRLNLGRTFDQDEAVVEIIGRKRDPINPANIKRIGKVLGVLCKRHIHPRNRYFLCRPYDLNPAMMIPYDKKLACFNILRPFNDKPEFESVPVFKRGKKKSRDGTPELKFEGYEKVEESKVYVVRFLKWSECWAYPLGFVESSFLSSDFQRYLSLEYHVPTGHKTEVVDEVRRMDQPEFGKDISFIDVFTIDPEGSQDLDDAVSFSKCSRHRNCYEIGIHITDVASIVREGTVIDKDAQRRRSTFYGPEQPIHMLPAELSTGICSILPNMIRQAISTTFHSCEPPHSQNYTPVKPVRTYIKSSRKLTYSEAEKLYKAVELNRLDQLEGDDERYANTIHTLWNIMWEWRLARLKGEAFYKRADTFEHILDSQAHLLIEEAMIATNYNTAQYLTEWGYEIPMRMQDMPLEEDWTRWEKVHANLIPNSCYMRSMKKHLKMRQRIRDGGSEKDSDDDSSDNDDDGEWENVQNRRRQKSKWMVDKPQAPAGPIQERDSITMFQNYWAVMKKAKDEGHIEGFTFVAACDDLHPSQIASVNGFIRTQKKAYFTTQDSFHFSLRLQKYAWSTSPIRRYADILVQRCILKSLDSEELGATTRRDIIQFCNVEDNRHKEFEDRFTKAVLAKSFEDEPVVLEACIEQVTDAYVKISIPLAKFVKNQNLQIPFGNLMVAEAENQSANILADVPAAPISCMKLGWKLRYYKYSDQRTFESEPASVVKLPIRQWKQFVQLLSSRPSLTREYEIENNKLELRQAIERLDEAAEVEDTDNLDILTGETRNEPIPIKHKREITWRVKLGTSIMVQLSSSLNTTQLPTPDIQLFSIANNLDVCVEHMKEPLTVYAKDAMKPFTGEIRTLQQYRGKWEPLVRMDAANSAVKENSSSTIQGVKISWKMFKRQEAREGSFFETNDSDDSDSFQLKSGFCSDRYIDIHQGDLLCLRLKGIQSTKKRRDRHHQKLSPHGMREHYTAVIHALVTDDDKASSNKTREDPITFEFQVVSGKIPVNAKDDDLWTVEVIPLSFAHRYMQKALCGIASPTFRYDLLRSICLEVIEPTPVPWNKDVKNKWIDRDLAKFKFKLNREQRSQEQRAITFNFSLIQGPPGTGKSFLGAHIAAKFAYMNKDGGSKNKVIYVGPSNKSVDVAAGYLIDVKDLKVIRMYSKSLEEKLYPNPLKPDQSSQASEVDSKAPDSRLKTISLHEMIRFSSNKFSKEIKDFDTRVKNGDGFTRAEMNEYSLVIRMAKIEELRGADIVICTCSCSCQLIDIANFLIDEDKKKAKAQNPPEQSKSNSETGELNFAQCIIDECAMCSEPETILPLFSVKPQQVVLIGDHMQLRPVVTCNKAERLGLSESLFMRYKEHAGMLTTQYRMHPDIMKFPSDKFYDGRLVCDDSVYSTTNLRRNDSFNRRIRAIFWNVKGEEGIRHFKTRDEGDQSKFNNAQAHAVVQLLLRLHSYNIPLEKIMILSPYTAQCARIREILKRKSHELSQVHVGTVVTSQGSESDYVILSTVRALPSSSIMPLPNLQWLRKHLGFLTDHNQINVALTRAKKRLFIIGDRELLRVDSLWRDLLQTYERNGAVTDNLLHLPE